MKQGVFLILFTFSCGAMADWVEYATRSNGDVFSFDAARVQKADDQVNVWSRIRYKTSVMGAASQQSHLEIDCTEQSEKTLQSTFFSDKAWTTPAMATNTRPKPSKKIKSNSATEQLAELLCQK